MNCYAIWASGGMTAKIEAASQYLAVAEFMRRNEIPGKPIHCYGYCIGSNPAGYIPDRGAPLDIKVWRDNRAEAAKAAAMNTAFNLIER